MKQQMPPEQAPEHHSTAKYAKTEPRTEEGNMETMINSATVYQKLFDVIPEGIMILDAQTGQIVDVNARLTQMLNCTRREFLNRMYTDILSIEDISVFHQAVCSLRTQKHVCHHHIPLKTKDGKDLYVTFDCHLFEADDKEYVMCGIREKEDTLSTSRAAENFKADEEKLRKNEEKYRDILENIEDGYYEADLKGNFTFFNEAICRIWGYTKEELMGMNNRSYMDQETAAKLYKAHNEVYKTGIPGSQFDYEIIRKDGTKRIVQSSFSLLKDGRENPIGFRGIIRDVTLQKRAEEALRKSEQKYRTIVENSQEGIFQASPQNRNVKLNQAFASMLGYSSTQEAENSIKNIPKQIYVNPKEYQKVLDIVVRDGGIKGYETEFYRKDKSRIWVSMSVSAVRDKTGNLIYYHGIVEDITPKRKLEQEHQESITRLRRSLGATINAMSATVEARDPYTAGHQRRVADLARAIATEMNLSRDQIDGIRLAGMIHDIGKISVPSEILTKPTRLTNLEFELIKTHSEAGFNILKDIEFPWPIARIVLEHHERINGTGYPQGLNGEDILLESKIIAVADVVEAISSNRPYRPAFGLEPALDEVAKSSGVLYDKDASDACLKLFRENRYKMPF